MLKDLAGDKRSSLFLLSVVNGGKSFIPPAQGRVHELSMFHSFRGKSGQSCKKITAVKYDLRQISCFTRPLMKFADLYSYLATIVTYACKIVITFATGQCLKLLNSANSSK